MYNGTFRFFNHINTSQSIMSMEFYKRYTLLANGNNLSACVQNKDSKFKGCRDIVLIKKWRIVFNKNYAYIANILDNSVSKCDGEGKLLNCPINAFVFLVPVLKQYLTILHT